MRLPWAVVLLAVMTAAVVAVVMILALRTARINECRAEAGAWAYVNDAPASEQWARRALC